MAHFALVGPDNVVQYAVRVENARITDENGVEQEQLGIDYLNEVDPPEIEGSFWVQTSYNHNFNRWFAQPGALYFPGKGFTASEPVPYTILNEETLQYEMTEEYYARVMDGAEACS